MSFIKGIKEEYEVILSDNKLFLNFMGWAIGYFYILLVISNGILDTLIVGFTLFTMFIYAQMFAYKRLKETK